MPKIPVFASIWCLLPLRILTTLSTHHSERHRLSEGSQRGWREGVGDERAPKHSEHRSPELCSPSSKDGMGKRAQKRGLNPRHRKDLLAPTPSARQPPFRNLHAVCHSSIGSEGNITRVARNLAFARKKKALFLSIFCLFSCVWSQKGQEKKPALNPGTRVSLVKVLANWVWARTERGSGEAGRGSGEARGRGPGKAR